MLSSSPRTSNRVGTRGSQKKYDDDDDEIDDNDDNDDEDDDDDDDNDDGYGVFFFINIFLYEFSI